MKLSRLAVTAALSLASCETSGAAPKDVLVPVPSTAPTLLVDVGTGESEFAELMAGDPVAVVYGSQGGFHVWTAVRVHDDTLADVQVNLTTRLADGSPGGSPSRAATSLLAAGDGTRRAAGLRNFVDEGTAATGTRFVIRIEVVTRDMRHGAAERIVTSRGPGK